MSHFDTLMRSESGASLEFGPLPLGHIGSGFVGALKKFEQGGSRRSVGANVVVHKEEIPRKWCLTHAKCARTVTHTRDHMMRAGCPYQTQQDWEARKASPRS